MKTHASSTVSLAVFLAASLGFLLPAGAVLVEYTGEDVASSPWSLTSGNYSVDSLNESITFGPGAIWAEQAATAPGALWSPGLTDGFVEVAFRIDVGTAVDWSTGLSFATGTREWNVLINEGALSINGAVALPTIDLGVTYTLSLTYDAVGLDASLDGVAVGALQNVAGFTNGFASAIYLHRYTGSIATDSQATFFEVNFAAVPEPGTVAMCTVAGVFGMVFLRRRKSVPAGRTA